MSSDEANKSNKLINVHELPLTFSANTCVALSCLIKIEI